MRDEPIIFPILFLCPSSFILHPSSFILMKNDLFNLSGEVAAVLGGTGVLGGAMAEALAGAGARVAVVGRSEERGLDCVRRIEAAGGTAIFQQADAMSTASLAKARDAIEARWGTVTVLVNGAGGNKPEGTVPPGGDFCKMSLDGWEAVFDLNLVGGALLPCQVFGETMVAARKGSIINIASMSSILPLSRVVSYSASKAAVLNLTLWLAREWATKGVRVNAISPGFFPAEQNRRMLLKDDGTYTERGQAIVGHTPMGRFGDAHELAGAVVWLASPRAASFVTGQNIVVDGGFSSVTI
jgi:NAD(P)-dependent dehydrogenase (short-subunit alcohol dehydrogenase family)